MFPPENATGKDVKGVQQFPVSIWLDKDQEAEHWLRPGSLAVPGPPREYNPANKLQPVLVPARAQGVAYSRPR